MTGGWQVMMPLVEEIPKGPYYRPSRVIAVRTPLVGIRDKTP